MTKANTKLLVSTLAIAVMTGLAGCGESVSSSSGSGFGSNGPSGPNTSFNEAQLVSNLTDNVITPTYQAFQQAVDAHQQSVNSYCSVLASEVEGPLSSDAQTARTAMQNSWTHAMDLWQQIEVMQVGVLVENNSELRNLIYSWPVVNSCSVDQDVVYSEQGNINGSTYDIALRTNSRRGLDALEYLTFASSLNHSCSSDTGVIANWNTRPDLERRKARCAFAQTVTADLKTQTARLMTLWAGENGYAARLKSAGQSGSEFDSVHTAVNRISDAMFYIDSIAKDKKLATPLGIFTNSCGAGVCTDALESRHSMQAKEHLISNMKGFEKLFTGNGENNGTIGFDDFLKDVGDLETSQSMSDAIAVVMARLSDSQGTLTEQLNTDASAVEETHAKVKTITDAMKTDFIVSLSLELPATSAGDND